MIFHHKRAHQPDHQHSKCFMICVAQFLEAFDASTQISWWVRVCVCAAAQCWNASFLYLPNSNSFDGLNFHEMKPFIECIYNQTRIWMRMKKKKSLEYSICICLSFKCVCVGIQYFVVYQKIRRASVYNKMLEQQQQQQTALVSVHNFHYFFCFLCK